ncbi:glycosyltransferase [[Pseudomonas] boreopolis]|uniref:glycosyltransferase n=1 Tax=Xanthomonas boreopolis TaxID=86183 RepID=UPI003D426ADF
MTLEVSVVIPVYGSATILPRLAARLESALDSSVGQGGYEVVLVHDHGPDNSWQVISDLAATRSWLRGLDLRRNAGQHNAIMAGLSVARGRFIVTMDDDLQHDPDDIPRILSALRSADLCYVQFESRQHALWKRAGSAFNDLVASRLLKKPRGLYLSPFRGFRAEIRDEASRYNGPFVYLDGLLLQSTDNIVTIQAQHHARSDGKSGYSLKKSISLWLQMATSFSIVPLRFVSLAGMAASLVAFLLAVVVFWQKLHTPQMAVGWPSLIITILFMGGLQLLALGAIGEYTGRILLNINNRPQYVIGRTANLDDQGQVDRG